MSPTLALQRTFGNQGVQRLLRAGVIQAKLRVSQPNDPYEQEADRVADQVMRTPQSRVQRKCAACTPGNPPRPEGEEEQAGVQRKHDGAAAPATVEAGFAARLGSGSPLPPQVRNFFEPRFGRDFGAVRVHAGAEAEAAAAAVNARAFTLGRNVVFAAGEYDAQSTRGRSLLAHELAHFAQHDSASVWREPYKTRGIPLDRGQIATMAGQSYWEQRTLRTYLASFDARMNADPEERDAVLAALWGMSPPTAVGSTRVMVVPIAARTLPAAQGQQAPGQAPVLLYRFTFNPPRQGSTRPRLDIEFVASGAASAAIAAPAAPASYRPTRPAMTFSGFPGRGTGAAGIYFAAHGDEHRALFQWMETIAPATFDQIITTSTQRTRRGRTTVTHRSVFHVSGSHSGTTLSNLRVDLVSEGAIDARQTVPADYRGHDMGDLELEELQARSPATDRLGTVTLPGSIPAAERLSVKYAIWQYFDSGHARNTEVDAIVPVGATGARTVLYTLNFGARNNVTVTRIGAAGTGSGQVDVQRIDVSRVRGFPGITAAPTALRTWWSTRYPRGGTLTPNPPQPAQGQTPAAAPTAATLIADMNRLITAGIANRSWFDQNYGIEVLDAAGTATRLRTAHAAPRRLTRDTLAFSATDLRMLELSLQTLTDAERVHLRGLKLGRKTASITRRTVRGRTVFQAGSATQAGVTLLDGSGASREITVLYFRNLYVNNDFLFRGSSAADALPDVAMTLLHELGHATGYVAGIETAFNAWIRRHPQASPTWYAASDPGEELFPEAFALYHTDPHFLCNRSPLLYAWFDALASTGSAPAAGAALTAPAVCP